MLQAKEWDGRRGGRHVRLPCSLRDSKKIKTTVINGLGSEEEQEKNLVIFTKNSQSHISSCGLMLLLCHAAFRGKLCPRLL